MSVTSHSVTDCIYIPGFCFIIIVQLMMSANSRIRFGLQIVFVCLYITPSHYHHCANLSEDIQLIMLCVFSLLIFHLMIERIYTLSYYHHQIGSIISITIIHCLWLGHETMVCAVCLYSYVHLISLANWKQPPIE